MLYNNLYIKMFLYDNQGNFGLMLTHKMQFYWIYNIYFHLKFEHVVMDKSHLPLKGVYSETCL